MSDLAKKEEMLLRALNVSNFSTSIHEDLSDLITYVTPPDTPLFSRLRREKVLSPTHEWTETTLTSTFTDSVYADGGAPTDTTNSTARRNNKVMQIGRIAKATEFLNAANTVGNIDAFAREVEEKMQDVMRAIEYWIFQGDKAQTSPQQMDGLFKVVTAANGAQAVANGNTALVEAKLQELLVNCYAGGGRPDMLVCNPVVAQRIANFVQNRTQYTNTYNAGGVSTSAMTYMSPLGHTLEIVPVRADLMGASGTVFVLDSSKMSLGWMGPGQIVSKELSIGSADIVANRLIKAYVTLIVKNLPYHGILTGVTNSL